MHASWDLRGEKGRRGAEQSLKHWVWEISQIIKDSMTDSKRLRHEDSSPMGKSWEGKRQHITGAGHRVWRFILLQHACKCLTDFLIEPKQKYPGHWVLHSPFRNGDAFSFPSLHNVCAGSLLIGYRQPWVDYIDGVAWPQPLEQQYPGEVLYIVYVKTSLEPIPPHEKSWQPGAKSRYYNSTFHEEGKEGGREEGRKRLL